MYIKSIDEIIDLFPSVTGDSDGELHSPCPFCTEGRRTVKNGIVFRGDDRLVWFADRKGVSCRHCGTYSSMEKLLELLAPGSELSADFEKQADERVETSKKPLYECLTTDAYVNKLHRAVDKSFWKKFLWSDTTIERFKLGYGLLYEYGSYRLPRHIIPFVPRNTVEALSGYMLEGRLNKRSEATDYERYNIKTQGSVKGYFWLIKDSPNTELVITEGPKDAITAWQLGYKNVMAIFGTSLWRPEFANWIADEGYTKVTIFGDNDDAGKKFIDTITKDLHSTGVTPYRINWPKELEQGFDLTDAYVLHGDSGIGLFLSEHIRHSKGSRGWIADIHTFLPNYTAPKPDKVLPLQTVRADMPTVLHDYIDNYKAKSKSAGRGVVKVLAAPPGSGKSYSLVHLAQEEAKKLMERKANFKLDFEKAKQGLFDEIEQTDDEEELKDLKDRMKKLDERLANYSVAKVLFASPFINAWDDITSQPGYDASLWFNFESRNTETCENHEIAHAIGAKGYSVMKFCETGCAFADNCASRVRGYLMQKRLMKTRPITFVRHANLISQDLLKEYEIIIIDENFLNIFADFQIIENLVPTSRSWRDFLTVDEEDAADGIEALAEAVNQLNKLEEELSGKDCLLALERFLGQPLAPLMRSIPDTLVKKFQPHAAPVGVDVKELPPCVFPTFYRAIMDELADFEKGEYYNSRIHLARIEANRHRLKVSTLFPLELPRSKKIIVADGTAMPELYGLMFAREVELYEPDIHNPSARIIQLTGSDVSRNTVMRQVGSKTYRELNKKAELPLEVTDIFGETVDLSATRYTEDMYDSKAINSMIALLRSIALKDDHDKVLFVTYKNLRMAIEDRVSKLAETDSDYATLMKKVAFGHYGGLRGTNRYKDYDAVLLAGCPRQPYNELWRVIQSWARLKGYDKYIPNQLGYKPSAYHGIDLYTGYTYITFEDEFAQSFVDMVEAGEIRQCLDRIRIYSSGSKTAYLYMARPAAKWVTEVTSSRLAVKRAEDNKYLEVEAFVKEVWEEFGAWPKYATVGHKFSLTVRKAKDYVEAAKRALNPVSA